MPENRTRALLTCFVAIVMVVGFTAAPVAAVDDGLTTEDDGVTVGDGDQGVTVDEEGVEIRTGDDDSDVVDELDDGDDDDAQGENDDAPADLSDAPVPEEVCTDAGETLQEEVPVEDVPWLSDLPEEAQPPNVPAELVTPRTVVAIVAGVTPNQCEVQDPNDPSYDPLADGVDPDASATPAQGDYEDGFWGLLIVEATLDQSGSGPSASGMIWTLGSSEDALLDPQVTINDGEKDYAINPTVGYGAGGTGHADIEAWALNRRAGTGVDCDGEECTPDASGVPADAPAVPAPTGQDGDDDSSQSDADFPEEICTDVPQEVHDNVPWNDLPWIGDLPEELQPPNVPANLVTPRTASSIVVGVTPGHCEIQDPNDPSYDPREDDVDPDASVTPAQGEAGDGYWGLLVADATLDQSGDGPGIDGVIWTVGTSEYGTVDADVTLNDGEKDYAVNPEIGFQDDGTGDAELQVRAIGKGASTSVECDGDECQPDATGLPAVDAPAVPAPTGQDGDDDSSQSDGDFPEEICTDVPQEFHDNVPWDDVPWFHELPEDAQPPGIVTGILHPQSVSALVVGTAPNHCDAQDPNDPSYDPREDDVDPDASVTPAQGEAADGYWGLLVADATLDQSGDGPGIDGVIWTVGTSEYGNVDVDVTLNDGEKDYAINPTVGYGADGTGHADIDIRVLNKGASVGLVCDGEECRPDAGGVPAAGGLAIPAPTGQDDGGDDDSDDSDDDSGSSDDGSDGSSGSNDTTDSDDTTDTQTSAGGAGTAGGSGGQAAGGADDGDDGSADDADATNEADENSDDESDGEEANDSNDDADESSDNESDDEYASEPADEPVRSAAESDADGAGFGVGLAVLSVLFATLMARRRL